MQDFNTSGLANTLWAKTDAQLPDVFEALCASVLKFPESRFEVKENFDAHEITNAL